MGYARPRLEQGATTGDWNQSLTDLVLGTDIILRNHSDAALGASETLWTLLDKPIGSSATITSSTSNPATLTPIDVEGTYLIELSVDGNVVNILAGVPYQPLYSTYGAWRTPGYGETTEDNYGNNEKGWLKAYNTFQNDTYNLLKLQYFDKSMYNVYMEDFFGDVLADELIPSSCAIYANQINGVARLDTTGAQSNASLVIGQNFNPGLNCVYQTRVKINDNVNTTITIGFDDTGGSYARFSILASTGVITCQGDGGVAGAYSNAIATAMDNDWHVYQIKCFDDGSIKFYYDDLVTEVDEAPANTTDVTSIHLAGIYATDNAVVQERVDTDYFFVYQDRV